MTASGMKTGTPSHGTLTEQLDAKHEQQKEVEVIPPKKPQVAEALILQPGEIALTMTFSLAEIGVVAASLQTCVQWRAVTAPSQLNLVNSVLRKIHDAKQAWVEEHP